MSAPATDSAGAVLREEFQRHPYLALAGAAGLGWLVARRMALPVLGAVAGVAGRFVIAAVAERVLAGVAAPARKT